MGKNIYSTKDKILRQRLVEAREQANLTQEDVAKTGIISQSELSKIENGQRRVEYLLIIELSTLYNKEITFFDPNNK